MFLTYVTTVSDIVEEVIITENPRSPKELIGFIDMFSVNKGDFKQDLLECKNYYLHKETNWPEYNNILRNRGRIE